MTADATTYARALLSTTDRYLQGCLTRATWDKHMKSLWGTIRARGLTRDVLALVDPQSQAARRFVRGEF